MKEGGVLNAYQSGVPFEGGVLNAYQSGVPLIPHNEGGRPGPLLGRE